MSVSPNSDRQGNRVEFSTLSDFDARLKAVLEASEDIGNQIQLENESTTTTATPNSEGSGYSGYERYQPDDYQDFLGCPTPSTGPERYGKENQVPSPWMPSPQSSPYKKNVDIFENKLHMLASSLEAVEARSEMMAARVEASEAQSQIYAARLAESEEAMERLVFQSREREDSLRDEVARLQGTIEAQQLASNVAEETLRHMVSRERKESERLRHERDQALRQRADALLELSETASDMEAMQATLADCAAYCRYLRNRCTELELETATLSRAQTRTAEGDVFGLTKIKEAINSAVSDMGSLSESERKKQIRQLQLRWHPDKNPVLKEFATEVTKLINEAVANADAKLDH